MRELNDLAAEVARQDSFHAGYTATRDSLRLALATVEDEVREALDGWREDRCKCGVSQCSCSTWPHLREEALQAAAIIVRMVRAIDGGSSSAPVTSWLDGGGVGAAGITVCLDDDELRAALNGGSDTEPASPVDGNANEGKA